MERGKYMSLSFLVGPVTGAIIGGITNSIAIKMLFRPLNPIKIGNYTLPFTPGVIPKEKARIASNVGTVISEELLNEEVLREWLLKKDVYQQISETVDRYMQANAQNEETVHDVLCDIVGKERSMHYVCELEEQVTERLYRKVISMELGELIVSKLNDAYKDGHFASLLGPMSFFVNDNLVESITSKIAPIINHYVEQEGEDIIRKAVEEESGELLNLTMAECVQKLEKYQDLIKNYLFKLYENVITKHLGKILKALDIAKIVEERILALDMAEMERIILSIMKKELNAIVWFGVLLGAIMGYFASII